MAYQMIYCSRQARRLKPADLDDILTVARENNARDGITGLLVVADGMFLQVLEGERAAVERCFERIAPDPRHRDVVTVMTGDVSERMFDTWSMGLHHSDAGQAIGSAIRYLTRGGKTLDLDVRNSATAFGIVNAILKSEFDGATGQRGARGGPVQPSAGT